MWYDHPSDDAGTQRLKNFQNLKLPVTNKTRDEIALPLLPWYALAVTIIGAILITLRFCSA